MIPVTKPFLPPKEKVYELLDGVFERNWLTNNGPLLLELESRLKRYLSANHLQFVTNGTIALQIAIKVLGLKGEIITTPYSYVATSSSILWEGCKPIYVDINESDFCIDPDKIEEAITSDTSAILATHVYGIPCDTDKILNISRKYKIKVIYDAAHAFGVELNGEHITNYGDISTLSFHATKPYHSVEGGAIITNSKEINEKVFLSKAFGHVGDDHIQLGINGKASEFHAAVGLCVLNYIEEIITLRKQRWVRYNDNLYGKLFTMDIPKNIEYNYSYFPIVFETETQMVKAKERLFKNGVESRRYFFPSLNDLPYLSSRQQCEISESISSRVLCLPLYHDLELDEVNRISSLVIDCL